LAAEAERQQSGAEKTLSNAFKNMATRKSHPPHFPPPSPPPPAAALFVFTIGR